jgi:hypothetical protein
MEKWPIERYEVIQHREELPTGKFISVMLYIWIRKGYFEDDAGTYKVGDVVSDNESSKLPQRLMKKIKRLYPSIYSGINERHELKRIKEELDNAFSKERQ